MTFDHRWILIVITVSGIPFTSCKERETNHESGEQPAATVVHQEEKNQDQPTIITLSENARKRIDVQTAPINQKDANGTKQSVLPFAALFYAPDGDTWTFTNTQPLTYMRQRVKVARIVGDDVYLTQGPAPGTQVVTIGAALLYGAETDFEED
jgi:hypothetical protein